MTPFLREKPTKMIIPICNKEQMDKDTIHQSLLMFYDLTQTLFIISTFQAWETWARKELVMQPRGKIGGFEDLLYRLNSCNQELNLKDSFRYAKNLD